MSVLAEREAPPSRPLEWPEVAVGSLTSRQSGRYALVRMAEIRGRIEVLSERRQELWRAVADGDEQVRAGLRRLDREIERLWDEQRRARATVLFGDRRSILERARVEHELETAHGRAAC
jgi:hypothetical protein